MIKNILVPLYFAECARLIIQEIKAEGLTSVALSDEQTITKSFYLEQISSNYSLLFIYNTECGYYPTPPFWPLTCYLKSVNGTHSNTKTESVTTCHTKMC